VSAQYGPVLVDRPPAPRRAGGATRKSALVKAVEECVDHPNRWWRVAVYDKKSSAYSACRRMRERTWGFPIAFVVRPAADDDLRLALYVKVLLIEGGSNGGAAATG
jgi:hypothetical protein